MIALLKEYVDMFAWKPEDMIGIPKLLSIGSTSISVMPNAKEVQNKNRKVK